ncbi:MAG: hypothetical protein M3Z24_16495 [Chloroflexota bacterium]|nr:hypothetical protein [Chloroflexota bacterium]
MSFQIWIKTEKSLQQLATEMCTCFSLPPFHQNQDTCSDEPYYQFEILGLLILLHPADEIRDPEVLHYAYCFDLQMAFTDHQLDTDAAEYQLQPYYAQLLSFRLGVDTAHHEKQKENALWKIRYRFYSKNPHWDGTILYGEEGWKPAVIENPGSRWRSMHQLL